MAIIAFAAMGAWMAPAGFAAAGFLIGGYVGYSMSNSGMNIPDQIGPRLGDAQIQVSQTGQPIALLWGQQAISGNVIWRQYPWTENTHTETQEVGGKGGGGGSVSRTWYSYQGSLAVQLCEGPVPETAVKAVWANDRLLDWEALVTSGKARFYRGTETQLPDSIIETQEGVGNVPGFRGTAYVVLEAFDFEPYGNVVPQFRFELEGL